ncbi:MAG: hypothetical protein PHX13_11395 [Thiovulaceae bacterium]|nr:hypothetical protein [Sulfurimonadaceae bacterium]
MPNSNLLKQKGYAYGCVLHAFISELHREECIGAVAILFNILDKTDKFFKAKNDAIKLKYLKDRMRGLDRSVKIPQGLSNFLIGNSAAAKAWQCVIDETHEPNMKITISSIFLAIWRREKDVIALVYKIDDSMIQSFFNSTKSEHIFASLKLANMLIEKIDKQLLLVNEDTSE